MYDIKFATVSGSDWTEIVEVINDDTNLPLTDVDTALIEIQVNDRSNCLVLSASTADATITRPASGKFQWKFTKVQMDALCVGVTYRVGCRMTLSGDTTPLFTGDLAFIDGEFEWH
jgi:hypothetical protein